MHKLSYSQRKMFVSTLVICATVSTICPNVSEAQRISVQGPEVSAPVSPKVLNKDLRQLPKAISTFSAIAPRAREVPRGVISQPKLPADIMQREDEKMAHSLEPFTRLGATPIPTQSLNFPGIGYTQFVPPDTNGSVGLNHYIQTVNAKFAIYDKQGNLLSGPTNINQLWSSTPNDICAMNNNGDPYALYDHLADRWVISQFAIPNGFQGRPIAQCVAVSRTSDPVAGGWFLYTFNFNFNHDYPKLGVWPDAYYLSSQQGYNGGALNAIAFDRTRMLAGQAATFQSFTVAGPPTVILLPSDLTGPPPPVGTPNFFARPVDGTIFGGADRIEIYAFHVDWTTPLNSTFTLFNTLTPAAFSSGLCNPGNLGDNCAPQPNTTVKLETQAVWPLAPLQYRNFGDHETLVFNHTVNSGTSMAPVAGERWYDLQRPPGGNWFINQQQTFSPDNTFRWMGSAAMDKAGDMALGYSVSSGSLFPSIRYVGRLSSDPPSQMTTPEVTLASGNNSQIANGSRWGDYSAMRVDPADGCTFWYTNQFSTGAVVPDNSAAWATQIGAFRFPTCNPADLAITKTAAATVVAGTDLTYTIGITNHGPSNATNLVLADTLPSGVVLGTITGPNSGTCTVLGGVLLTCRPGNLANGASITYTITVHVPSGGVGSATITNTAHIASDQFDPNPGNDTASATTTIVLQADLSITKSSAPNPVAAGTTLTYTVSVHNSGPSDAPNVVVTDTLPTGVTFTSGPCSGTTALTCNLGTLVNGASKHFTVSVKIPADFLSNMGVDTATITNKVVVTSTATDPNSGNNMASVNTKVIAIADLDLTMTGSPNPVHEGGVVTYTMHFTNTGPSDAIQGFLYDYLPDGFTFVSASIFPCGTGVGVVLCNLGPVVPAGFTVSFPVRLRVRPNFLQPGETSRNVINSAKVTSHTVDPDAGDFPVTVVTTVIR